MSFFRLCLVALGSFGALFIIAKFIGHKQIAQLDFFDYITGITIGSIAAEMATELEEPWKPLVAMVIYGAVTLLLSLISNKFPQIAQIPQRYAHLPHGPGEALLRKPEKGQAGSQ